MALTIEAGRRCDSGPGSFTFETQQAEKIFSLIQSNIKQKTSTVTLGNQTQEGEQAILTNTQAHSPLCKIPDMISTAVTLENKLRTQERKSVLEESARGNQEGLVGSSECVSTQPAPITLMPLPLVPTHDSHSGCHLGGQSEAVYADPADCIQTAPKAQSPLAMYVDPASVLPLKPPSSRNTVPPPPNSSASHTCFNICRPDSVYSEVYDKISPVQNKQNVTQSKGETTCFADDEPIYTEPMRKKEEDSHKNESKPDPFAHLYAQVCKKSASSSPSSSSVTIPTCSASSSSVTASMSADQSLDVIYENLGII